MALVVVTADEPIVLSVSTEPEAPVLEEENSGSPSTDPS